MEKGVDVRVVELDENLDPVKGPNGKLVYAIRGAKLLKARDLWPQRLDIPEDAQVAVGEHYVHDDWWSIRTSLVQNVDHENGLIETRNSVYRVTDGKIG
ncbi:hypothetical protein [Pseudomonas phage D6]|nr:hypothetical protein [Pseudomonas phage D6]